MSTFTKIRAYDVEVTVNNTFNLKKGIICIQGYNLSDFDSYRAGLMKQHKISNVGEAYWIKTKTPSQTPASLASNMKCQTTSTSQEKAQLVHEY